MRRTVLVLSTILLASFGIANSEPNPTQDKPGATEPKMTPEDAAKKNPVAPTAEGLAQARKTRDRSRYILALSHCRESLHDGG